MYVTVVMPNGNTWQGDDSNPDYAVVLAAGGVPQALSPLTEPSVAAASNFYASGNESPSVPVGYAPGYGPASLGYASPVPLASYIPIPTPPTESGPGFIGGVITLSALIAMLLRLPGGSLAVRALTLAAKGVVKGGFIGWALVPDWVKPILIGLGAAVGLNIIKDIVTDDDGTGSGLRSWTANGVRFEMQPDGRVKVWRKNGTFRFFRYKRPIVIYAGGAGNLRTFLRADAATAKQSKRLSKAIARHMPKPRRAPRQQAVLIDTQPGPYKLLK